MIKVIPTNELVLILQSRRAEAYDTQTILNLFNDYGDDYDIDGDTQVFRISNENQCRKELIHCIRDKRKHFSEILKSELSGDNNDTE